MHTSTGASVSDGYTSSLGPAVAVGLEISPGYIDQIVPSVVGRCAQYAGTPASVMPAAPNVAHLAPTTTTGSVTLPGAAGAEDVGDAGLAAAECPRVRSKTTKPTAARAITARPAATPIITRRRGRCCPFLACRGP